MTAVAILYINKGCLCAWEGDRILKFNMNCPVPRNALHRPR